MDVQRKPSDVSLDKGLVLLDGTGGLAATFAPEAAKITGERLIAAAVKALASEAAGDRLESRAT